MFNNKIDSVFNFPNLVCFAKGEPRNVEYCKFFLLKCNIWVLRTRKLPDAKFFFIAFCAIYLISMQIR